MANSNLVKGLAATLVVMLVLFSVIAFQMSNQLDDCVEKNTTLRNLNSSLESENSHLTSENNRLEDRVTSLEEYTDRLEEYIENVSTFYETPYYTVGWVWRTENHLDYNIHVFTTNFGTEVGTANIILTFKDSDNVTRNLDYKSVTVPGRTSVLSLWQYTFPDRNIDNIIVTIDQ